MCCDNLEEPLALMKMGLSVILVGHVNFLLGALVHGIVLRQINLHEKARGIGYAITNVVTLISGMLSVVVGILAIILSKNKKSKRLTWSLFSTSLVSTLMAGSSTVGLFASVVMMIIKGGRVLLTHCRFPDAIDYSSVTNECPFDPTRVYSTTMILWVGLIVSCTIQTVFCARCVAACVSFLGLPGCPRRLRRINYTIPINVVKSEKETSQPHYVEPPRRHHDLSQVYIAPPRVHDNPPTRHTENARHHDEQYKRYTKPPANHNNPIRLYKEPPRSNNKPLRRTTAPPRPEHQVTERNPAPHNRSVPSSETQPLRQSRRDRMGRERQEARSGSQQRRQEQPHDPRRSLLNRSSFWI